jgi:hydrogenase small subunit
MIRPAGLFAETWDDENAKRGYCLYKLGCRGPVTYNACGVTEWNGGVSFPIKAGHGCIGCSENNFWDNGPFYERISSFPGFGIESNADDLGKAAAAVTGAAILGHAIATNVRKGKMIQDTIEKSRIKEEEEKS